MKALFKLILWLIFLSPFLLAGAAWFALSDDPLVVNDARLSHKDIAHAQQVLRKYDPREQAAGTLREIHVSERDLNLAANYLIQQLADGGARVNINPGYADAVGTLRIPGLPRKSYLNIRLELRDNQGEAQLVSLQLGELKIPAPIAEFALAQGMARLYETEHYQLASNVIKELDLQRRQLRVVYEWDPELVQKARSSLLDHGDAEAMLIYHNKLVRLQSQGIGKNGSLPDLLKPMFAFALQRSRHGDPVVENQSMLAVLGAWASRRGLEQLVPQAPARPSSFKMKLERRTDFGQHFLTSAALASRGDGSLSDAIGLYKEISDSNGGSGFSFTDIAADRAGTRFGELATGSAEGARYVQQFMARGVRETDIMPLARDLPEHMNAEQFRQRFGQVGSPAYNAVMQEIEKRLAACLIYKR